MSTLYCFQSIFFIQYILSFPIVLVYEDFIFLNKGIGKRQGYWSERTAMKHAQFAYKRSAFVRISKSGIIYMPPYRINFCPTLLPRA